MRYKFKMFKLEVRYHIRMIKNIKTISKKLKYLFIQVIIRKCDQCNEKAYISHSNCAYEDELSNYYFCCKDCHDEIDERYQEMWDEYNSGRL